MSTATITVTAQDGIHTAVVSITLTRLPSSDCSLSSIRLLSDATGGVSAGGVTNAGPATVASWTPPSSLSLSSELAYHHLYLLVQAATTHAATTMLYRFGRGAVPSSDCPSSTCTSLSSSPSAVYNLNIGASYLQLSATAQAGQVCTYTVAITRRQSSDASIAEVSANPIENQRVDSSTQLPVTSYGASACPYSVAANGVTTPAPCHVIDLHNGQPHMLFRTSTNHSLFCGGAPHACVATASVRLDAPRIQWSQHGSESGI